MKIPNKLRIGRYDYDVKLCNRVDWTNKFIGGQINYLDKTIRVRKSKKDNRIEEDTFFHEIAHGLFKEMEFNHPKITKFRNDESFIQEFGLLLRKTFLDLLDKQGD